MRSNHFVQAAAMGPRMPAGPGAGVSFHPHQHPGRPEVERFISAVYQSAFDAEPSAFAPTLVALRDDAGRVIAAAGFRPASDGALFLEHYLSQPAERLITPGAARSPSRADLVEVGHLCAAQAGAGRSLAVWLAMHLERAGFLWVLATLTLELRHLFLRMGVAARVLNPARPESIGAEAARWGRYYEHQPLVLAASLEQVGRTLRSRGGL